MDDLKFLELFGDIDEKIVQQANDDLNRWQETREGEVVRAGGSRISPLRIVLASAACAAVLFGAVFLLRNYLKNGFTYVPDDPDSSSVQSGETSNIESEYTLNSDVMWAIGKTVNEVAERYGEITMDSDMGSARLYQFKNGYGTYSWYEEDGGCKMVGNVSVRDLLTGDLSTVNLDNIAQKYGFDVVPLNPVPEGNTMYDDYIFAYYTHPSYKNLTFSMCYKKSGFDEDATFRIRYDENSEDINNGDSGYALNDEVMWAIGKTFDEVAERYGGVAWNAASDYRFNNGYGIYSGFEEGGCNAVGIVSASDLLTGDLSTVDLYNMASKYGLENFSYDLEQNKDTSFATAYFTHPSYKNILFIMNFKRAGFDDTATFYIRYYDDEEFEIIMKSLNEPLTRAECEQIIAHFKSWGDLNENIHPDPIGSTVYFPECVDASQFFTEEVTTIDGYRTYTEYFYLIASGDFATEEGFDRKLDGMFTEKFKEQYKGSSSWRDFRFKDGEVYVSGFNHYSETEPKIRVWLEIKSVDETTVVLSVMNFDVDNAREYTATLFRTKDGGFKIDDVGDGSFFEIPSLFHYKNIEVIVNWHGNTLFVIDDDTSDQSTDDHINTINSLIDTSTDVAALIGSIKGADGDDRVQKVQVFEDPYAFEKNVAYSAGELKGSAVVLIDFKDGTHYITYRGERTTETVPFEMMFSYIIRRAGSVKQLKEELDGYNRGLGDRALTKITLYQNEEDAKNGSDNGVTILENGKIVASDEELKSGEFARVEYDGGKSWFYFSLK